MNCLNTEYSIILIFLIVEEIIKKRKEKFFDLSKGINLVEKNKNISKISEENFLKSLEFKKVYKSFIKF